MTQPVLPADDPLRRLLHDEVHARPSARLSLPARVTYVAVLNEGVAREDEHAHLLGLPSLAQPLTLADLSGHFLRLALRQGSLQWERHTEFTRYTWVQSLSHTGPKSPWEEGGVAVEAAMSGWISTIPGRTISAIRLIFSLEDLDDPALFGRIRQAWPIDGLIGSRMGGKSHSWALTDLRIGVDGFEQMLVLMSDTSSPGRAGRISQRLLEVETYRLMALRGLPVAKALGGMLNEAEAALAAIMARMEGQSASDQMLLDDLVALATRVERATAEHGYRFAATRAYDALVSQRIAELREKPIQGIQTLGEFMQRRLSPAMATVVATQMRLASLSERVTRASALLRTRVDIAAENQNQQLLEKLTQGQQMQLQLQTTVEGLSIAAISYYVVSLLLYAGKAAKAAGWPVHPEMFAGLLIPVVLFLVWCLTRRLHARLGSHR
jgi:uncharacterized membrane-anchored protein